MQSRRPREHQRLQPEGGLENLQAPAIGPRGCAVVCLV